MKKRNWWGMFLIFSLMGCYATVPPGHVGLRFDPWNRTLEKKSLPPGNYPIGFFEQVIQYPVQLQSHTEKVEVITRDDLRIEVIATIIIKPIVEEVFELQTKIGRDFYNMVVQPEFRTCIRNVMTSYPMIQISKKTPDIEKEIKTEVTRRIQGKHVEVDDVVLSDINYSQKIFQAIEEKLTKEQQLEAMKFQIRITQKDNEMERMKAKREAEIRIIEAEAEAKSSVIKARATAEAQEMINSKLTTKYIQYKALENPNNKIIYYPLGKDSLPVIINPQLGGKPEPNRSE
ncbi:SPFH domain/Band 7 family protein [Leptospira fainei serovar Hurstbridge str. BUT 6]|uniref:SPFH domain/Band 7 family protein n=1 Tax=Leptospira fainei serovar Hurstbridge str. BUT 6 TaxID=1193011 RepID=S3W1T3_9LEPT|nr:prohibitin family protein [Leptospira fainei]EPG74262.1 SPFH domain/Band 7 family protein [Leptospira fainei serovar Hurstbridge str. BUT 6]